MYYCNIATVPVKPASPDWSWQTLLIPLEPFTPSSWVAGMGIDTAPGQAVLGHPCPLVYTQAQPTTEGSFSICNTVVSVS